MRFKSSLIALSLSLICFLPRIAFADTLELTSVVPGNVTDGVYTYPYNFTINGTETEISMSCLSFDREVTIGETWTANSISVLSIGSGGIDGESQIAFLEDAYLYNQYAGADAQQTTDIQFAIWDIMDPSGVANESGPNANAKALVLAAQANYNSNLANYADDTVFIPTSWPSNAGEPQIFMVDNPSVVPQVPAPPATPEPSSLILLGTGLVGMAGVMRRKLGLA